MGLEADLPQFPKSTIYGFPQIWYGSAMDLDTWRPAIVAGGVILVPIIWNLLCAAEDWLRENAKRGRGEAREHVKRGPWER